MGNGESSTLKPTIIQDPQYTCMDCERNFTQPGPKLAYPRCREWVLIWIFYTLMQAEQYLSLYSCEQKGNGAVSYPQKMFYINLFNDWYSIHLTLTLSYTLAGVFTVSEGVQQSVWLCDQGWESTCTLWRVRMHNQGPGLLNICTCTCISYTVQVMLPKI